MGSSKDDIAPIGGFPEYDISEDIKRWFGSNFVLPMTLHSDFDINPSGLCPPDTWLDYLIVVKSSPGNFMRRRLIRSTFGRRDLFSDLTQRTVFLLGRQEAEVAEVSRGLRQEVWRHQDIVQGQFTDSYMNLTLKAVMGLRWISAHCPRVKFLINIDDDVWINIFQIVNKWIPKLSERSHQIACPCWAKDAKKIERNDTRWRVADAEFRGLELFPVQHCNGFFALLTGDLLGPLMSAARVNPQFWIDDVYMYGLLPHTVGDVQFTNFQYMFTFMLGEVTACIEAEGVDCKTFIFCEFRKGVDFIKERFALWDLLVSNLTETQKSAYHVNEFI